MAKRQFMAIVSFGRCSTSKFASAHVNSWIYLSCSWYWPCRLPCAKVIALFLCPTKCNLIRLKAAANYFHVTMFLMYDFFFRFVETGLFSDFNKVRMKLSELASLQIHALFKKSQNLERRVMKDTFLHTDRYLLNDVRRQHRLQPAIMAASLHPQQQMFYPPHNAYYQCAPHQFR